MDVIDEEGRLFGLVNVIDALVVLLVVAVIVAGVALVTQSGSDLANTETGTVTATLDLGTQPNYLVEQIATGDTVSPDGTSNLTITEIYLAPQGDAARVILTVELEGVLANESVTYAGAPPRIGRQLTIQTDTYQVDGTIRTVNERLPTSTTGVLIEGTVDSASARAIQPGDSYTLAGHEVATVEDVEVFGTGNPEVRQVFIGLSLHTTQFGDGPRFGDTAVRPGATISLITSEYALQGTIRRVGSTTLAGEPANRTVTLELTGVRPELANTLRVGLSETVTGERIARITDVDTRPAMVVLTSQDGQIFLREHPIERDVMLTAELAVRETPAGPTFKGHPLQQGGTIVLDLETVTIEATVESV